MIYVVMTKWVNSAKPIGAVKEPACNIAGVVSCQHLSGATAADGGVILCVVECDQTTADKIEATGVGKLLWQTKDRDAALGALNAASIGTKLTTYGVKATTVAKLDPLKTGRENEVLLRDSINGVSESGDVKIGGK